MKFPPYKKRTRRALEQALRWAQRELSLDNWRLTLVVDEQATNHPDFRGKEQARGRVVYYSAQLAATLGIWRAPAEVDDLDPLHILFHELSHLSFWWEEIADPSDVYTRLWERMANQFACLLCDLFQHK